MRNEQNEKDDQIYVLIAGLLEKNSSSSESKKNSIFFSSEDVFLKKAFPVFWIKGEPGEGDDQKILK